MPQSSTNTPNNELPIISQTYDLALWIVNHTAAFPRKFRFGIGARIETALYDLLESLLEARYARDKSQAIDRANLASERLRFLMRMAKDLACLTIRQYGYFSERITGIGAMIGGWRKMAARKTGN